MTNCKHEVRRPTDYNDGVEPARPAASKVIWVNEEADGIHVAYGSEEKARNCAAYSLVTRIAVKYQEVRE